MVETGLRPVSTPVYLYNFGFKSGLKVPDTDFPTGTADVSYGRPWVI